MNKDTSQLTKKERKQLKKQKKLEQQKQEEQARSRNKMLTYGIIIASIAVILLFIYRSYVPIPAEEGQKSVDQVSATDWVKGNPEASVVLVEYSDFQCPACQAYAGLIQSANEEFGDDLAIVYRHFPLKQIHLQAELAARAAEAAGKQGKFWEMHDMLFDRQEDWADDRGAQKMFEEYADDLGLDVEMFSKDINSKEVKALVKADYQSGLGLQINSTPTFFLQGEQIENPRSNEVFLDMIRSELPATGSATPAEQ